MNENRQQDGLQPRKIDSAIQAYPFVGIALRSYSDDLAVIENQSLVDGVTQEGMTKPWLFLFTLYPVGSVHVATCWHSHCHIFPSWSLSCLI